MDVFKESGASQPDGGQRHQQCAGVDVQRKKSISREETFERYITDMEFPRKTIIVMIDQLAKERLASIVAVKIRYCDFQTYEKEACLSYTLPESAFTEKGTIFV